MPPLQWYSAPGAVGADRALRGGADAPVRWWWRPPRPNRPGAPPIPASVLPSSAIGNRRPATFNNGWPGCSARIAPWDLPTADVVLWADVNLV